MRVVLNLRAESPVAFRTGRDAGRAETLPYIPGSALLGGLAAAHTILYPHKTEQFGEFFVRGRVRYGNAYPASFPPVQRALQDETSPVRPLPLTARSCKRWPGFRFQRDADHEYHGVFDHLLPWALFALSGERAIGPLERVATCPECNTSLDTFRGFYRRAATDGAIGRSALDTTLLTRTGISRTTGAAHAGILYSREAVPEGATFWAELTMPDKLFDKFRDFADEAGGEGLLRVGTNRTRGLGRLAVVSCRQSKEADTTAVVAARVRAWNELLKQAAKEASVTLPPGWYVPITLASDALVLDPLLRWRLQLDGSVLADSGVTGATLVYHTASVRRVTGWNGLWGLPREDALAIGMGSVFVVRFEQEPDFGALLRLQEEGIGERKAEGFGRVTVADPFHREVQNA
jgi:CRISPR-associated Csx10 family RAMP protein